MAGYLALILHAHLPFVRHPEHDEFLEEDWLFEAITESYLPLLGMMERLVRDGVPFKLTSKITALVPEKALSLLKFATQGDFLTPTCPSCSIKMISRKSTKEGRNFWGCRNYPHCKQIFIETANAPA